MFLPVAHSFEFYKVENNFEKTWIIFQEIMLIYRPLHITFLAI